MVDQRLAGVHAIVTASAGHSRIFENRRPRAPGGDDSPRSAIDSVVEALGIVQDTASCRTRHRAGHGIVQDTARAEEALVSMARLDARVAGVTLPTATV